jgi:hypothetical protein
VELRIGRKVVEAIKLGEEPAYRIAWRAGLHPATVSKLLHGAERIREFDPRVLRLAAVLGVPAEEAFDTMDGETA